ncbi:putative Conjugative transfer relaxase protein TraI [Vibrio nigripulchritudo MADA3029]|uniref:conjugative transfer relaxase/helicase TraI n=1 Tax=Vibrio nigripulchritudo TaxID=28173 RepID=UPI0003B1F510|nr:conjugative transfer relaxase/helicase TraI [Vibrio nigripulchritudo]CCN50837.1 putative Conjugative transfer relaxase protein TraI [Vibrio nigripulchritudo MADA3020]CCN56695.1 putative Conjugative transfer relaxase protein TraI [Vibrio nigripulchritudo MADA3021]CCN62552.1 putative Conjugative transfer relaxase protein TraI [Vibrio nigripulchritudo MADA3029]
MLSITPIKTAATAASYYLTEEVGEKEGADAKKPPSFWLGKLAREAGMKGQPVKPGELQAALEGTWRGENIHGKRHQHRCGFDLTLSAPKSLSIMALMGGDERLLTAHDHAVKYTLAHLEKDTAQAKITHTKGTQSFENTGRLLFAVIRHQTSRENDPQLHSHALMLNMTRDSQGRLRALASRLKQDGGILQGTSERIYHFQKYYTALYQSHLAKSCERLGYATRAAGKGQFEIDGVPVSLIETCSSRSHQIDQRVLELGYNSQATRDYAAKNTRQEKTRQDPAALQEQWQKTLRDSGFDARDLVTQSRQNHAPSRAAPLVKQGAREALIRAVSHLGQHHNALHLETLVTTAAFEFVRETGVSALDIKAAAEQWIADGKLQPVAGTGRYTTRDMIETEQALLSATQGRAKGLGAQVSERALSDLNIDETHRQQLTRLIQSSRQFHCINVFGPTHQVSTALSFALTASNITTQRLNQGGPIPSDPSGVLSPEKTHTLPTPTALTPWLANGDKSAQAVWVVDEAQKMSARELLQLSSHARDARSKVVLLNRTTSRQGRKAHNALDVFAKGHVVQTDWLNHRHTDSLVTLHPLDEVRIAQTYARLPDKDQTQVLVTARHTQKRLTDQIRQTLQNAGQLSRSGVVIDALQPAFLSPAQTTLAKHYQPGMVLRHWTEKVRQDYLVTSSDTGRNTLDVMRQSDGQSQQWDLSSKAFRSRDLQVWKPTLMLLGTGERVTALQSDRPRHLQAHHTYTVTHIEGDTVTLKDPKGAITSLDTAALNGAPLAYEYVKTAANPAPKPHTLLVAKAYALSRPLLSELTDGSQKVDVFTDDEAKALQRVERNEFRPSAIERLMDAEGAPERYLSQATAQSVRQDVQRVLTHRQSPPTHSNVERAVQFALAHLSERNAAFSQQALVVEAVRYAFSETDSPVTREEILSSLAHCQGTLSADYTDGTRWTTRDAMETENAILTNIASGKDQRKPFATSQDTHAYLARHSSLTRGQRDAITLISTTSDAFVGVQGLAGTGKSTMLETNVGLFHAVQASLQPARILGLAPTHAAVSELETKGIQAQTLASLLSDLKQGKTQSEQYQNTLFFLDESSMVSNRQALALTELVLSSHARLVMLGDKEQLLSLGAGKPFELAIQRGTMDVAYMTDIVRQQPRALRGAVHNMVDHQPYSALAKLRQQSSSASLGTEHVVSTRDKRIQDPALVRQMAAEALPWRVAQDYLSRTEKTRAATLVIAYTNQERDDITHHIRQGRQTRKEMGDENIPTPRLRAIGASNAELKTMMPYQKGGIVSLKQGHYATITRVDQAQGVVMLKDDSNGQPSVLLPAHRDHRFTTVFSVSSQPLSKGDRIMTRFTDKTRGIRANVEYTVTHATQTAVSAQSEDGKHLTLDPRQTKDGHWDYAYTRTADMAQGATYPYVLTAIKGKGQLTNIRRAYIDVSRGSQHVRLYTDNPESMMRSWLANDTTKLSALDTLEKTPQTHAPYFNDAPLPKEDPRFLDANGAFNGPAFSQYVHGALPHYTESLTKKYLGSPNQSKCTRDHLVFGRGRALLKVNLTGPYRGHFQDESRGEKGALIALIMREEQLGYGQALARAHELLTDPQTHHLIANPKHDALVATLPQALKKREENAKRLWSEGVPVNKTPLETYLSQFNASSAHYSSIRYHQEVYSSEDQRTHPAMLAAVHDNQKNVKGVEITYLTPQGEKNQQLTINPRRLGNVKGHWTEVEQGTDRYTTIISTRIEDGLEAATHASGKYDVLNVGTTKDLISLSPAEVRAQVLVILSGQQQALSQTLKNQIVQRFENSQVRFVSHEALKHEVKTLLSNRHAENANRWEPELDDTTHSNIRPSASQHTYSDHQHSEQLRHHQMPKQQELDWDHDVTPTQPERQKER